MAERFGLHAEDIEKLNSVFKRHPQIEKVVIYGSRAKGNYRPGSDIDITLKGCLDWPLFNEITIELDDLLLPYSIDISLYDHLDQTDLKDHIDRVGQVLYTRGHGEPG